MTNEQDRPRGSSQGARQGAGRGVGPTWRAGDRQGGLSPFILHTGPELGSGHRFRSTEVLPKRHWLQGDSGQMEQTQGLRSREASPSTARRTSRRKGLNLLVDEWGSKPGDGAR